MRRAPATTAPGPRGVPVLGALPAFGRDPLGFLTDVTRDYGDTATFWLGPHRTWLFNRPEDIEAVLVKNARIVKKDHIYALLRPLLGDGLVTSEGDTWRRQRKLAAPSFQPRQIRGYAATMVARSEAHAERLEHGATIDLTNALMHLTMEIVLETLFGSDAGIDRTQVGACIETFLIDGVSVEAHGWRAVLPAWVPTPGRAKVQRALEDLDAQILPFIEARRRAGHAADDLLGRLLEARDDDGSAMDDAQLRDEVVTLFTAGHETTALTLLYAFVMLSEYPDERARLHAELDEVLGDAPPSLDDLPRLPYTAAVINEVLRLYPPAWAIGREAVEPFSIGEHAIEVGDQLLIAPWVIHRDARRFDDPLTFRPERWLDGLEKRLPRYAYLPFGGGPRVCIGNHFALMEAQLVLASLARRFHFEWTREVPMILAPSVTLRIQHPIHAVVHARRR